MLKPGDVVTDLEEDSYLLGKQGLVVNVQLCLWGDAEVTVRFDRKMYPHHIEKSECPNGVYEVYPSSSLRRDNDWKPQVYARRLFGDLWHSISVMKDPVNPQSPCLVEGCCGHQQRIIWFNIWGSVYNAYVCEKHASQYHGLCGESFPWREKMTA